MKRKQTSRGLLLAAVVSALSALPASAQVAAQQSGRALDANNRVGSGGFNGPGGAGAMGGVSQNQIIYGNVTGGKEFRGPIAAPDPGAFMGPSAGRGFDRFIAGSAGVPQSYQPAFSLSTPQPFFGQSRQAPPPPGSVREGFTGSYLGTALTPQSNLAMSSTFETDAYRAQPLGQSVLLNSQLGVSPLEQGELMLQGPLEANNRATLYTGSPLYGIRLFRPGQTEMGNEDVSSLYGPSSLYPARADRFRYESAEIERLRDQLSAEGQNPNDLQVPQNPIPGVQNPTNTQQQPGQIQGQGQNQNQGQAPGLTNQQRPFESPENQAIGHDVSGSTLNGNPTGPGAFGSGEGVQQHSTLMTPGRQSLQYTELQRRLQRYEGSGMATADAQRQAEMNRQAELRATGAPNQPQLPNQQPPSDQQQLPATRPVGPIQQQGMLRQQGQSTLRLPPMRIESMATGMRGTGVRDLLKSAEDLMRQGKFQTAIDKYNVALRAVPNNPLVFLGRANAELGAGFYRQAANDLHQVFLNDRATLMAQYDLKSWIPADRMQFIEKDLKNLASQDPKDEMPAFLLAYVYYNTGDSAQASDYLKQATERSGGRDPLLPLLQSHWSLQGGNAAPASQPDLNK